MFGPAFEARLNRTLVRLGSYLPSSSKETAPPPKPLPYAELNRRLTAVVEELLEGRIVKSETTTQRIARRSGIALARPTHSGQLSDGCSYAVWATNDQVQINVCRLGRGGSNEWFVRDQKLGKKAASAEATLEVLEALLRGKTVSA
jgi:hypothetical protein